MCDKQSYETAQEARQIAQGMSRHGKGSMGAYYCWQCRCWHVKTNGKRRRKIGYTKYKYRYQPPERQRFVVIKKKR